MIQFKHLIVLLTCIFTFALIGCKAEGNDMRLRYYFDSDTEKLIRAIENDDKNTAESLINKGVSLNVQGKNNSTPLYFLLLQKNKDSIRLALELGADPNFKDPLGENAITLVSGGNDDELLSILLENDADPNTIDSEGEPAIFSAISFDRIDQVRMFIKYEVNLNLTDGMNMNAAFHAVTLNKFEIAYYLIDSGADIFARDSTRADIAWEIHNKLSNNLIDKRKPSYEWALKVQQQLLDGGIKFPPMSPREVRFSEGTPNEWDLEAKAKEDQENQ